MKLRGESYFNDYDLRVHCDVWQFFETFVKVLTGITETNDLGSLLAIILS